MRAAGYIRVSTEEQAQKAYSLDAQTSLLQNYAKEHGMDLVEIYADRGVSASKNLNHRKALLRMITDAEQGYVDVILFKDITRWSRNAAQYYKVQDRLDKAKVGWIAVEQPYLETVTPTGRFQVSVMLGTSQLEADQTGQRIKFVQDSQIAQGHYPFPPHCAPTGYKTERRESGVYLVPDEETVAIIQDLFKIFLQTLNLTKTREYLREKFDHDYAESNLNRMIRNPIYKGEFRGIEHFCEPIISEEIWTAAQRPKRVFNGKKHAGEYLFSGIVKCGKCGRTMHALCSDDKYYMYQCKNGCKNVVTQNLIEQKLMDQIAPAVEHYQFSIEAKKKDVESLEQQRKRIRQKIDRLTDLYVDDQITRAEYDARKKKLTEQLEELRPDLPLPYVPTEWIDIYDSLSSRKKSILWRSLIDHVVVYPGKKIDLAFPTAKVLAERLALFDANDIK